MIPVRELARIIGSIDGRGYGAYKELGRLTIRYDRFTLSLTHIQGDPHAPPSVAEVRLPLSELGAVAKLVSGETRVPIEDFSYRVLYSVLRSRSRRCGSGNSCYLGVPRPSPVVVRRSAFEILGGEVVVRFYVGLPARDRRVSGARARELFLRVIPSAISELVERIRGSARAVEEVCALYKDQEYLREWLYRNGFAAFVADGSVLPRESSISDRPMKGAVPFSSPPSLRRRVELPSGRVVTGMAIPLGVVVITGGGYHGKSTLLEAIQRGVYNHIRGDGREFVVSRRLTVAVAAEDGRIVNRVDISSFISELPGAKTTVEFSTLDASGSTSMAASISEAVELGAELILIDEDNSATNLLFKDEFMEVLIPWDPIKPLSLQARSFVKSSGAGLIVISSSSSAFLCLADRVVRMRSFVPEDVTTEVRRALGTCSDKATYRRPRRRLFQGVRGVRRVRARGFRLVVEYSGGTVLELDLRRNPRIVEEGQVRLIAGVLRTLMRVGRGMSCGELKEFVNRELYKKSFAAFFDPVPPDLTWVDGFDVVWVLNRLLNAEFTQASRSP